MNFPICENDICFLSIVDLVYLHRKPKWLIRKAMQQFSRLSPQIKKLFLSKFDWYISMHFLSMTLRIIIKSVRPKYYVKHFKIDCGNSAWGGYALPVVAGIHWGVVSRIIFQRFSWMPGHLFHSRYPVCLPCLGSKCYAKQLCNICLHFTCDSTFFFQLSFRLT